MSRTNLMWQYQDPITAPSTGQLTNAPGSTSWGVRDLAVTVNTYYTSVFNVTNNTDGFRMQRVRVRANSFFCASHTNVSRVLHGHTVPWSIDGLQDAEGKRLRAFVIQMNGRNWEISDCDLYSSWGMMNAGSFWG